LSIKVLLADDSEVMRRAIAKLLNEEPSTSLVGEAKGFAETIQLANSELITSIKLNCPPGAISGV
jgi:DNA-binding NarL/FixJ family response regulator